MEAGRERAERLLARLRMRTEARGATAAEAAAAAELAERIIQRYGLDRQAACADATETHQMPYKRMPGWACVLAMGICKYFGCEGQYTRQRGQRTSVIFHGQEHRVAVAAWLFAAVAKDLDARAVSEQRSLGKVQCSLRWRNKFRLAAAWEVYGRMLPVQQLAEEVKSAKRQVPVRRWRNRRELSALMEDNFAMVCGARCGREIDLNTNVLGRRGSPDRLRLEEA